MGIVKWHLSFRGVGAIFMVSEKNKKIVEIIKSKDLSEYDNLYNLLQMAINIYEEDNALHYCLKITKFIKDYARQLVFDKKDVRFDDLYWESLKFEAPMCFKSFLLYMEKNRNPKKKFYQPRRKTLKVVVDDLQDLADGIIDFYGLSMPPRVGKSSICIFFLAWVIGNNPNSHNAMGGHSGILAKGFYKEALNLITTSEYTFSEIFPNVKLENKSAEEFTINLNDPDRFATLTCRGMDGTWTGAIDVSADGYLYVDDLIRDRTESLSPVRLENRYQDYLNVMVDRKNDGARELMVGTRWNIMDPLGKIEKENRNNPRYRFRKIPALNENNESNFVYDYGLGFSIEYYLGIKEKLDKNEWEAKYQQRPFIREGLLFPEDSLRYYNGTLPDCKFVRCVSACDVAWGGGDSLSMPIGFEYENGDVFIADWVFNKGKKEITIPIVAGKIMQYSIQQINFEANNGGEMYAKYISDFLKEQNYKCSVTHTKAPNTMAKMAKIIQYSGDVMDKFIFLDEEHRSKEYQGGVDELTTFVQIGKNEHDDAPDGLVQLEKFIDGGMYASCEAMKRPW